MNPSISEKILAFQHQLHQFPELSLQEFSTTDAIRSAFAALGMEELALPTPTGCAFRKPARSSTGAVMLRADIDALAGEEAKDHAIRSQNPGAFHGCGHDVHMAGLYGAALLLAGEEIQKDVIFLFQPGEETAYGGKIIADSGFLEKHGVEAVFGLHNIPQQQCGTIALAAGPVMAAKNTFRIRVLGRSGHGACPETTRDPIVAASAIVLALQTVVSRNVAPMDSAVVTVASIHAGQTDNRIEDAVTMLGSIRTLGRQVQQLVLTRVRETVQAVAQGYGCQGEVEYIGDDPAVENSPLLLDTVIRAAAEVFPQDSIEGTRGMMISEDFSWYGFHVPSFFAFLGSGFPEKENAGLHSTHFCPHPDTAIWGAKFLAACAKCYQGK